MAYVAPNICRTSQQPACCGSSQRTPFTTSVAHTHVTHDTHAHSIFESKGRSGRKRGNSGFSILCLCHVSDIMWHIRVHIRRGKSHLLFIYSNVYCLLNMLLYENRVQFARAHPLFTFHSAKVVHFHTSSSSRSRRRAANRMLISTAHLESSWETRREKESVSRLEMWRWARFWWWIFVHIVGNGNAERLQCVFGLAAVVVIFRRQ